MACIRNIVFALLAPGSLSPAALAHGRDLLPVDEDLQARERSAGRGGR